MIEPVDVAPLFDGPGDARDSVDSEIGDAASTIGVLVIAAPPDVCRHDAETREQLLRVFDLPAEAQRALWRRPSAYRGWSPWSEAAPVDIYDLGPDVARGEMPESGDPLLGATPLPETELLPGWRELAAGYYRGMERLGAALLRSLARLLGLEEHRFDDAFTGGISTLRLMRYASSGPRPPGRNAHVDSGFVTLLAQHGVGGLQAKTRDGEWIDVPVSEGHLVVNFGALLERWTSGRVRATPHRVVSEAPVRCSIPFFFEPRVDALVEPLPLPGAETFEPFLYGDHLWEAMAAFPNFKGMGHLRPPRGTWSVPGSNR